MGGRGSQRAGEQNDTPEDAEKTARTRGHPDLSSNKASSAT